MGNGKSTTGNVLQKLLLQDNGKKFSKSNAFEAGKASQAVTTNIRIKKFKGMNIMDTPGFNDPKK